MGNQQTSAYIEIDTLRQWSSQISRMNQEAMDTLDSYQKTVKDLENYMLGNVSTGFINDESNLVTKSMNYHTKMQDVEKFLIEVINTMSNQ